MPARPLGPPVDSPPAQPPSISTLHGRTVRLERLSPAHADQLYPLIGDASDPTQACVWDYMPEGPFSSPAEFHELIAQHSRSTDPYFFAIIATPTPDNKPNSNGNASSSEQQTVLGYISLMSIVPSHLRLEIGHVVFSPHLQRSTPATETIYLLLKYAFENGYRRVEWKCNSLNEGSRKAARRFGFTYEGTFRRHMVVKGRSRDTAWFSIVKEEWEGGAKDGFEGWLRKENFDGQGRQRGRLKEFISMSMTGDSMK